LRCILVVCREGIAAGEACQTGKSESYRAGRREHHHSSRHVFSPSVD
jgi:hypothetical protein